jgi:hypothetical protein
MTYLFFLLFKIVFNFKLISKSSSTLRYTYIGLMLVYILTNHIYNYYDFWLTFMFDHTGITHHFLWRIPPFLLAFEITVYRNYVVYYCSGLCSHQIGEFLTTIILKYTIILEHFSNRYKYVMNKFIWEVLSVF